MASSVNAYVTLTEFKNILGVTSTTDDVTTRKIIEAASRAIETYTGRNFFITNETKYFDGANPLWIPDLLSINTSGLKTDEDGDGTYENTFATTDYHLYPLNTFPKYRIEINTHGDYSSFAGGVKKGVQIAGEWGYGDGTAATPYTAVTTIAEDLTAGETDITVTSATNLSIGNTIKIDSEQMYITAYVHPLITVETGINGTTEATHTTGATVYAYRYPKDIWQACMDLAVDLWQNRMKRGIDSERLGDYGYTMSREILNTILDKTIKSYVVMKY